MLFPWVRLAAGVSEIASQQRLGEEAGSLDPVEPVQ